MPLLKSVILFTYLQGDLYLRSGGHFRSLARAVDPSRGERLSTLQA